MNLLNVEISTNRLLLKHISLEYKEDIFSEFTAEITRYMIPRSPQYISETELFINQSILQVGNGGALIFVIIKKLSHEFLGCAGIHDLAGNPELGIWLKRSAHGNKYGLEAITAIKKWADENLNHKYISYHVDRRNIASRKIPEALGGNIFREYDRVNMSSNTLHLVEYRINLNKN